VVAVLVVTVAGLPFIPDPCPVILQVAEVVAAVYCKVI
jgi:hypothetical protein